MKPIKKEEWGADKVKDSSFEMGKSNKLFIWNVIKNWGEE